jgi:hypothetical protein
MGQAAVPEHPRLYFNREEREALRQARGEGERARIWANLQASADWCLRQQIRKEWIAPVTPDPLYENLYDRFYGIMHDTAIMEHLAFAWAYSGDERYRDGARRWTLACCRVWGREAEGEADGGKAYAVTRLLKGLALSYDLLYEEFAAPERTELREFLTTVGRKYFQWMRQAYTPEGLRASAEAGVSLHHPSVETASLGVVALALGGEEPEAQQWLDWAVQLHREVLLPYALAPSGAEWAGASFWASTLQYRILFMDALRRVTGIDLFTPFRSQMEGKMALAIVAGPNTDSEWSQTGESVVFQPCYSQIDYLSPVLLYLAREDCRPLYQYLARWDRKLGRLQKTRFITPNRREQLLFAWGGLAYAWYDPSVPAETEPEAPLSFQFPETKEAYLRADYRPGGLLAGCLQGQVAVHAGGRLVLAGGFSGGDPPAVPEVADDGWGGRIRCPGGPGAPFREQVLELTRPDRLTLTWDTGDTVSFWGYPGVVQEGPSLVWPDGTTVTVTQGTLVRFDPAGFHEVKAVANGVLQLIDPFPQVYPTFSFQPEGGRLRVEVSVDGSREP